MNSNEEMGTTAAPLSNLAQARSTIAKALRQIHREISGACNPKLLIGLSETVQRLTEAVCNMEEQALHERYLSEQINKGDIEVPFDFQQLDEKDPPKKN
jgi:hypothetical protein